MDQSCQEPGKQPHDVQNLRARIAELEEKLKETETIPSSSKGSCRLAQFAMDRATDCIYWLGPDAKFVYVNDSACESLGYTREELLTLTVHDIDPDYPTNSWEKQWEQVKKSRTLCFETHHRTKEGRIFPVDIRANYLEVDGKEFNCAIVRDISERTRMEHKLKTLETQARDIFNACPSLIFLKDLNGRYLLVNHQFEKTFHLRGQEIIGKADDEIFPPGQAANFRANDQLVFQTQTPMEFEETANHDDGPHLSIVHKFPLKDLNGEMYGIGGIATDITQRNRIQEELRRSQAWIQAIVENIPSMVFVKDAKDLRFVLFNKAGEDLIGYQRQELIGRNDYDFFPQEEADFFSAKDREVLESCQLIDIPKEEIQTREKGLRVLHTKKVPILDSKGTPQYLLGISQDITERKKAELEKAERKLLLTTMLNTGPTCIKRIGADGTLLSMNPAGLRLIEADSEEEAIGQRVFNLVLPEHRPAFEQMHQQVLEGKAQTLQYKIQGFKGTQRWMETYAVPFTHPITGQIEHLAVTHDITKRKRMETNLQVSEQSIRQLYEITSSQDLSFDEKIRALLRLGCQRFGLPYGTLTKRVEDHLELEFLYAPDQSWIEHALVPICESFCGLALEQETPLFFEHAGKSSWATVPAYKAMGLEAYIGNRVTVLASTYGTLCFLDRVPYPGKFTQADQDFIQLIARWIGGELERRQAEQALQESEQRFRLVCEAIPQQVWTARPDGSLDYVNRRVEEYFDLPLKHVINQGWQHLVHPNDLPVCLERWAQARQTHQPYEIEFRLRRGHDQAYRPHLSRALPMFNASGDVSKWFGTNTDIADLKQMETQLRQAQKMEAIGTLAGGIAHDFNNVLGVILGYAELAKLKTGANEVLEKNLQEIIIAGNRAKDLVQHILAFSRQEELVQTQIKMSHLMEDALKMVRATLPSTIEIHPKFSNDLFSILGDPTQIHQIVLNLCSNAEYAMRECGGDLEVGLENVEFDNAQVFNHFKLVPGRYVHLWIRDTGQGISQESIDRIFDPFFTTKRVGEGSGMGLSVVHGIVSAHQGAISVQSRVGEGTTFDIYFPSAQELKEQTFSKVSPNPVLRKKARVLFVDDEWSLACYGKEMLEELGCKVDICTNGLEALDRFRNNPTLYDVVISDQTMPGMTGEKLAKEFLKIRDNLPIILCTGFSHSLTPEKVKQLGVQAFLRKPVLKEDLIQALNNSLQAR